MAFEGAILDFDGTLVDSIDAWHDLEGVLAREAQATVTPCRSQAAYSDVAR